MCGIAGIWNLSSDFNLNEKYLPLMTTAIAHRGPDGEGFWHSTHNGVSLGHRRLSIIDLSSHASQPMHFMDRFVISFNGEIYNYLELKERLIVKGYVFQTSSDTEVVLAAYAEWNEKCLLEFDGMFAFAIYDKEKKELFCARDRFGEKPFFYSFYNNCFVFASEIKALHAFGVPKVVNDKLLYNYFVYDLVEDPTDQEQTFYSNILKLKSSHCFYYDGKQEIKQNQYWKINTDATNQHLDIKAATQKFRSLLETSVARRLRSDVELGSSLSGGLDSSSVVALVSKFSKSNHTFSARFPGFAKDEGNYIDLVKTKFKTNHHNVVVNETDFINSIDKLVWHQEEPFQTGSIFAQWCVYKEARKHNITVMLDGQGADEYLCGYDKDFIFYLKEIYKNKDLSETFTKLVKLNHNYDLTMTLKDKLFVSFPAFYRALAKLKHSFGVQFPQGISRDYFKAYSNSSPPFTDFADLKSMLKYEMSNQGLEKLLKFADRNSMAHSVEVRLPFLYHELVEFMFTLKSSIFLENGWSKAVLRNSMESELPPEILWRKDKVGFEAPHEVWLKDQRLIEAFHESEKFMKSRGIITEGYANKWKILIAYKFLSL